MATDYVPVNMPIPLLKKVDKIVENQSNGYRSRNEFCVDAVRRLSLKFINNYQPNKQHRKKKDGGASE